MIFVTHDQAEALSMAGRIVVLSEGRALQTGVPREIYERPASLLVECAGARVLVPRRANVRPGERVCPRVDPARVVLFDQGAKPQTDL
jgi:ABC-type sulfate/molybdate transport systems ATPase subunit